jgi:hypothetical protein
LFNSRTPSIIALDPPRLEEHVPYFASNAYFLHMKSSPNDTTNKNCVMESFNPSIINMNVLASLPFKLQG